MSWMTKEGSSSALGRWPLHFRLSELARCGVACPPYEGTTFTRCGFVIEDQCSSGSTTKGADICRAGKAVGEPPDEGGIYRSEGFG
jgi:hypothetical protein